MAGGFRGCRAGRRYLGAVEAPPRHPYPGSGVSAGMEWGAGGAVASRSRWARGPGGRWAKVTLPSGPIVEFRAQFGTPFRYQPGREVPVCYRAGRPEIAVIDAFSLAWLFAGRQPHDRRCCSCGRFSGARGGGRPGQDAKGSAGFIAVALQKG